MRFPRISRFTGYSTLLSSSLALVLIGTMVGCEGLSPSDFDPNKGFIAPGELAVLTRAGAPTTPIPILNKLPTDSDEATDEFASATEVTNEDSQSVPTDYTIGKNDLIQVSITNLQALGTETTKVVRVSESGNISLPLIGQMPAVGYTESALEQAIASKYTDAGILKDATVSVQVVEARNRTFSITGAVAQVGQYAIPKSDFRVLDAIVLAHGLTVDTDPRGARGVEYLYIVRSAQDQNPPSATTNPSSTTTSPADILAPRAATPAPADATTPAPAAPEAGATGDQKYTIVDGKPVPAPGSTPPEVAPVAAGSPTTQNFAFNDLKQPGDKRIIRVPIGQLEQGDLKYNIVIRPDDLIVVRPIVTGVYVVGGHVQRPGVFQLAGPKVTLIEALWSAGGLDDLGVPGRVSIRRRIENNQEIVARVDLAKISAGIEPDLFLKPDDVVEVGTNAIMPFIAAARSGFRITYGFGFLYDRNYAPQRNNNGG